MEMDKFVHGKGIIFAYCPECEGITVVCEDSKVIHKLGIGDAQGCVLHQEFKTATFNCLRCKKKTAIAKLSPVFRLEEIIKLRTNLKEDMQKRLAEGYGRDLLDWAASKGGIERPAALNAEACKFMAQYWEWFQLLRAIDQFWLVPNTAFPLYFWGAVYGDPAAFAKL